MLAVDPLGFVGSGWDIHGSSLLQQVQQMLLLDWIGSAIAIIVCWALHFHQMIQVIHFICKWFQYCSWFVYIKFSVCKLTGGDQSEGAASVTEILFENWFLMYILNDNHIVGAAFKFFMFYMIYLVLL